MCAIISRSLTAFYDGPGNGTGLLANVVAGAVAKGLLWLNSAGNSAGRVDWPGNHWRGPWTDLDDDGLLEFQPGHELLPWDHSAGCAIFINGLRWNDPTGSATDYDLYIFDIVADAQAWAADRSQTWEAVIWNLQTTGDRRSNPGAIWSSIRPALRCASPAPTSPTSWFTGSRSATGRRATSCSS